MCTHDLRAPVAAQTDDIAGTCVCCGRSLAPDFFPVCCSVCQDCCGCTYDVYAAAVEEFNSRR